MTNLIIAYGLLLSGIVLAIIVERDLRADGARRWGYVLLIVFFFPLGVIAWLLHRASIDPRARASAGDHSRPVR